MASPPLAPPPDFVGEFRTDLPARALYSEGAGALRIVPAAVALPRSRDDIVALVRHAAAEGLTLVPRAGGTGMPGHNVGPGIVVDLRALDRPSRVALAGTANIGAAVTCGVVNTVAGHFGMRFAPDPSSAAYCTIGGMVNTNAAGTRSLRCGSVRRWVRGVELVTADGEVGWLPRAEARRANRFPTPAERRQLSERLGAEERVAALHPRLGAARDEIAARFPATSKNSSGYALDAYLASGDILDLVIGSEGTLGIVTRAELQLERVPGAVGTLVVALTDLEAIAPAVEVLRSFDPTAIELLDRTFLEFAGPAVAPLPLDGVRTLLLVDVEGPDAERVAYTLAQADTASRRFASATRVGLDPGERAVLWRIRHAASTALAALPDARRSLQIIEDGCVPVAALGRYVAGIAAAAAEVAIPVVMFGHAGDGHLHVNALVDTGLPDLEVRLKRLFDDVSRLVMDLGGTPSGEHGDGHLRTPLLARLYGPVVTGLFAAVKHAFDPGGMFNPGVIVPDARVEMRLKVGSGAPEIPAEVAAALRARERGARWDLPPLNLLDEPT
ncbi:MAG: FAD-binding oxidoreductase [Gemmatimonadota bacterium]|nr:FAD-binding oxidoreductase [Gemmatimonadota bacterium]MDH4350264.1 FAD-binding oxidoreductase [Gemmatimonadota bacterium]MDH5196817.1 FAD-binding oxidoreductase [Gemmatimonadota bacterium]